MAGSDAGSHEQSLPVLGIVNVVTKERSAMKRWKLSKTSFISSAGDGDSTQCCGTKISWFGNNILKQ